MKKLAPLLLSLLLLAAPAFADITVDGYERTHADIFQLDGINGTPSTSDVGNARFYFDISSGKIKVSQNGGAWADLGAGGGGTSITLDLGDDGGNDSTALSEIATVSDTNNIFTESANDKLRINVGANWPTADVANAGDSATDFFTSGTLNNARFDADLQTLAAPTNWRIFYSNGSGAITELAFGSSGQYLKSNGAAAAPTWEAPAGGAEVNNLESVTTGIASGEIPIGTAADTVVYAALSGDATMSSGGVVTVANDSHTHGAGTLDTDSVSADELNATGVEAELEAVLDLNELQGAVTDAQVPNTITIDLAATAAAMSGSGQIDDNDLAAGAVDGGNGGEIADASITFDDLAADSVGESELIENMNFTATGDWDFGGGVFQIPNSGTLPGTCEVGDAYMDTDATTGQRFYLCESANTWALQGDGGGGGSGDVTDVWDCSTGDCNNIAASDGDALNFSAVNNSGTGEGVRIPQATDVSAATAEGQIGWDTDNDKFYIGTGSAVKQVGGAVWGTSIGLASATRYISPFSQTQNATATNVDDFEIPYTCSAKNLRFRVQTAPGAGGSGQAYTATLWTGAAGSAAATALTCQVLETAVNCSDTTNVVTLTAGNVAFFELLRTGAATSSNASVSFECN